MTKSRDLADIDTFAWTAYTPTTTNVTIGTGGVVAGWYTAIGKTVFVKIKATFGTTPSLGTGPTFSLPVGYNSVNTTFDSGMMTGLSNILTSGVNYPGIVTLNTNTVQPYYYNITAATNTPARVGQFTATTPAAVASGNIIYMQFTYEAA